MKENFPMLQPGLPQAGGVDPGAIAAAENAKARIQAAYIMALQKPRNENQARSRILDACKNLSFAEDVEYEKPVAGKNRKGLSIRYTEVALKEWGNVLTASTVVYEDDFSKRIKVDCLDLESNVIFGRDVTVKKTVERHKADDREIIGQRKNAQGVKVFIVKATEDELVNKENAMISKAIRNEGLRLLPADIKLESIRVARETIKKNIAENFQSAKKAIFDSFSSIGVWPKDLEAYLEHSVDNISPAELETLRAMFAAIKSGEATWMSYVWAKRSGPDDDNAENRLRGKPPAKKPPKKKPGSTKKTPKSSKDSKKSPPKTKKTSSSTQKEKNVQSRANDEVDIYQSDTWQHILVLQRDFSDLWARIPKDERNPKNMDEMNALYKKFDGIITAEAQKDGPPDA